MKAEDMMYNEACDQYDAIGTMELGSEEEARAVQSANSLMDRYYKSIEVDNECRKLEIQERQLEIEAKKLENDKEDRKTRALMTMATFGITLVAWIWANVDSKNFELNTPHTTEAGRQSQRRLLSMLDKFKIF